MMPAVRGDRPTAGLPPSHDPLALTWLLRRAVRRYAAPVSDALRIAGFGDLPQRGAWAVGALAQAEPGLSGRDLVTRMGISKQAVSQLVDALVTMGYVARCPAPDDRRRTLLQLTHRGRGAVAVIDETASGLEADMAATIGRDQLHLLHRALVQLDEANEPD
jgi:DNA-binding MarR family transcriptional regulator